MMCNNNTIIIILRVTLTHPALGDWFYFGEVKNDTIPHGTGTKIYSCGKVYHGIFENGVLK